MGFFAGVVDHTQPNDMLQQTVGQRCFAAWSSSQRSVVVRPAPMSFGR